MIRFNEYIEEYKLYIKKFKGCPDFLLCKYSFLYKGKKNDKQLFDFEMAENIFNNLLDKGFSWINITCEKIIENCLFIIFEVSESNYNDCIGKTAVNYCGPSIIHCDVSKLPNLENIEYSWTQ